MITCKALNPKLKAASDRMYCRYFNFYVLQFVNVNISKVAKNLDNIYPGHFPSEFLCTAFDLFIFFAIISVVLFVFLVDVRLCRYA